MTTKVKATTAKDEDVKTEDVNKAAVKPDAEGAITDASEAHIKGVAPLAAEDKEGTTDVDSVAVVGNINVAQVKNLQNETDLPEDLIAQFAEIEGGKFKQLLRSNQQGTADKYLHELAEKFVEDVAQEQNILVKADMVVKNYIRTV